MRIFLSILPTIFLSAALLLVSACADTQWPQWISGEPTREQLDDHKGLIPMPDTDPRGKSWPNLADVPERPMVILKDKQKDELVTEMKNKNADGLNDIETYKKSVRPAVSPAPKTVARKTVKTKKHKKKVTRHVP